MTRVALLDVNVLVALFDPTHIHHEPAHDWFADHRAHGWASCAMTETGFVRVLTNPQAAVDSGSVATIVERLKTFCGSGHHTFWPARLSLRDDLFDLSYARGHRQLTDVYLLGLAVKHRGRLATFDRSIPRKAVVGATADTLVVISPDDGP